MNNPVLTGPVFATDSARHAEVVVATEIRGHFGTRACPAAVVVESALRRRGVAVTSGPIVSSGDGSGPAPAMALARNWPDLPSETVIAIGVAIADERVHRIALQVADEATTAFRPRTVVLAAPRSFCAGVERAIEIVDRALATLGPPVFVRKEIVHNVTVIEDLRARGAVFVDELNEVPRGATVIFSAHGVSPAVRTEAESLGLRVFDATCPLVSKVHAEARRFAGRGDTIVLIGQPGHDEIEGTMGEAPGRTVVIRTPQDVAGVEVADPQRVSYLTQTTLAVDETAEVIAALRARFPAARGPSTGDICYAATNRQAALRALTEDADFVLVVGSVNSANSQHLVELSERLGVPARLVDSCRDVRLEWLAGANVVGLTAGASAPPSLVDELVAVLGGLGTVTVRERVTIEETTHFNLPVIGEA
jgi:4-hydroxy-3-methylbut-2-enyl diphosphate reductase